LQLQSKLAIGVKAQTHQKLKLKLIVVAPETKLLAQLIPIVINDLSFSGQFELIFAGVLPTIEKKSDIKKFFEADCRLGIFINEDESRETIDLRIYDLEHAIMVKGLQYRKKGSSPIGWAHNVSDYLWPILTNEPGFFSTKIAYCKEIKRKGKKSYKHIYVADYNGLNEKLLVSTPTVNIAPRWNNDRSNPLLIYSEHTDKNVRLMATTMKGKRKIVSNFEGLNILSAFSPDGKKFAYCASRGQGSCQIYYCADGIVKKLTHAGNNICPTFADNGKSLYFCSDVLGWGPQIYKYNLQDDTKTRISKGGFEVSTSFSDKKGVLAYAKMVKGVMQLFVFDPQLNKHKQLTFGPGNKEECSWSPCGNYLLFSIQHGKNSQVAVYNLLTETQQIITKKGDNCGYPSWSPLYTRFPCLGEGLS